jgi:hypothetical protein
MFCFSFFVGFLPLGYGFHVFKVEEIFLTPWSKEPLRDGRAVLAGVLLIVVGVLYYAIIIWAWSHYDR